MVFAIHWHESAMDLHVFPILTPPPPIPSLWVFPVHQPWTLVSCIQPGLAICFKLNSILVSMLFSQNIPPLPSPTESKSLFYWYFIFEIVLSIQGPLRFCINCRMDFLFLQKMSLEFWHGLQESIHCFEYAHFNNTNVWINVWIQNTGWVSSYVFHNIFHQCFEVFIVQVFCLLVAELYATLCDPMDCTAHQVLLSMGFSMQGYWSGLPFPSPGDLPNLGIEPRSLALQSDALPSWATREAHASLLLGNF